MSCAILIDQRFRIVLTVCAVLSEEFRLQQINMAHYSNVDHVIFDLDGILLGKYISTVLQDYQITVLQT